MGLRDAPELGQHNWHGPNSLWPSGNATQLGQTVSFRAKVNFESAKLVEQISMALRLLRALVSPWLGVQ